MEQRKRYLDTAPKPCARQQWVLTLTFCIAIIKVAKQLAANDVKSSWDIVCMHGGTFCAKKTLPCWEEQHRHCDK